ncbi:inactive beta-amylase 4, chloroplastic-like [Pyrus communis]|uniref:inactive beta-amylase 4, chloroplastic-like n=1 Tax=Pyrus communis TaxID=23211 RepID=UPI0035BED51C
MLLGQNGFSNDDYLTLGVDHVPLFRRRTALQCYEDFMSSFAKKFEFLIGTIIEEISVGLGPSGELKCPAHPFGDGRWKFPGISEFQCYDKYMMGDLKMAACKEEKPQWEEKGPQKAGVTTVSHLKSLSLERERKTFFLIMGVFSSYETDESSLLNYFP